MPCYDERSSGGGRESELERTIDKRNAMLCAVIRAVGLDNVGTLFDKIDYKEAGVSREVFESFWSRHLIEDEIRLQLEAKARGAKLKKAEATRKRNALIATLSSEDRKILGL